MKLTEKLNDFWEYVRDSPSHTVLEVREGDACIALMMTRTSFDKGSMKVVYRFEATRHRVWYVSEGRFLIDSGVHSTTRQVGVRDVYDEHFTPDINDVLGHFFHHFHHFPDLPTLKAISLKTLNLP